jgi:hypothetical protein
LPLGIGPRTVRAPADGSRSMPRPTFIARAMAVENGDPFEPATTVLL